MLLSKVWDENIEPINYFSCQLSFVLIFYKSSIFFFEGMAKVNFNTHKHTTMDGQFVGKTIFFHWVLVPPLTSLYLKSNMVPFLGVHFNSFAIVCCHFIVHYQCYPLCFRHPWHCPSVWLSLTKFWLPLNQNASPI